MSKKMSSTELLNKAIRAEEKGEKNKANRYFSKAIKREEEENR